MRRRIFQLFRSMFDVPVRSERWSARLRLAFTLSLLATLTTLSYLIFEAPDPRASVWGVLRHAFLPLAMFLAALLSSASYVQDIYELPRLRYGLHYVLASFFGIGYPRLRIDDGEKIIPVGQVNLLDIIGGPGWVNIRPGNVVLFESLRSPSHVAGAGRHFVSRFDTVSEIISLKDQHGFIEKTAATTRDGIEVVVQQVHYRYRLRTGRQWADYADRKRTEPYPFSTRAVKDLAYNRSVRSTGITSWDDAVELAVDAGITDYIKDHTFDHLTAPMGREGDPRPEIAKNLIRAGIRRRLDNIGTELVWFDIGHFAVSDRTVVETEVLDEPRPLRLNEVVEQQRIYTWGAKWAGNADLIRSYAEAHRLSNQERGRAEGQAELLRSIIYALEEAEQEGMPLESGRLRAILLARTAQVLDALAEKDRKRRHGRRLSPGSDQDS